MPESVHTLADLANWAFTGTALAVLGHPVAHSLSPAMHNAALARMAARDPRFAHWRYFRFDIPPDDLPRALKLFHANKFHGLNLTVPHKVLAFPRVALVDPAAQPVGAVNTLLRTDAGWHGFNTDGHGLAAGVHEELRRDLTGATVLLLGAGGAARGAAVECLQRRCAALWIANRTRSHLTTLLKELTPLATAAKIPLHGLTLEELAASGHGGLPAHALVINATSAGLRANDSPPVDLAALPRPAAVFDMVYNPPLTPLLRAAGALGLPHANGLSMLVHQGAKALEIWTKTTVPVGTMRAAAEAAPVKK
jgi:shikimate dehydrogenase